MRKYPILYKSIYITIIGKIQNIAQKYALFILYTKTFMIIIIKMSLYHRQICAIF